MSTARRREGQRAQKKDRYANDPTFRARAKAQARDRYQPKTAPSTNRRGCNKPRVLPIDDVLVVCISLGHAAELLGVHKTTLRGYEDRGVVPANRLLDSRGRRWYPLAFIELLVPIFKNQSDRRDPLWSLAKRVEHAWREAVSEGVVPVVCQPPKESPSDRQ